MRFASDIFKKPMTPSQKAYQEMIEAPVGIGIGTDAVVYPGDDTRPAIIIDEQGVPTLDDNHRKQFMLSPMGGIS